MIEKKIEKIKTKSAVSHMGDTFFKKVEENGNIFYLRRTNLLRDNGRSLNIVDEIRSRRLRTSRIERKRRREISTLMNSSRSLQSILREPLVLMEDLSTSQLMRIC